MPTYEYRCPKGHEFEVFQRMSDEPVADCPECGDASTRLLSAGGGFLFRGDGFYITDYRSDSYRAAAKKEASGAGKGSEGGTASASGSGASGSGASGGTSSKGKTASPGSPGSTPSASSSD